MTGGAVLTLTDALTADSEPPWHAR